MSLRARKEGEKTSNEAKDQDDALLSDFSRPHLECDTCSVSFTDMKSYGNHLKGKKHQKKASEAELLAKHSAADNKEEDSDEDDEEPKEILCEVCDKYISGYRSYMIHLKGRVHAKNIKKQKLREQLKDMPEVLDRDDGGSGSDDEDCLAKPYARCATCDKTFSGPEPFNSHVKSAAHKKKVKSSQTLQNLREKHDDGTKQSDDDEFFSRCDVCEKSFSGHIPYQIHMKSGVHKKNLEKKKVAEEVKQFYEETTDGYVCKECQKTFTNALAFKSHLENNSHEKQKAKAALVEFLSSNREIVFVTPLDKAASDDSDAEDPNSQYYLICKLCHTSFSGPESAKDHVKSKKHINAKKDKKIMKLLKEQKISSQAESSDKSGAANGPKPPANGNQVNGKVKAPQNSGNHEDFELL